MTPKKDSQTRKEGAMLGYAAIVGGLILLGGLAGLLLSRRGRPDDRISDKARHEILARIGKEGHRD